MHRAGIRLRVHAPRFSSKHQKQILLGDLLVNMGIVNESQVTAALETQRKSGKRLGQILIDKGFATRPALADALSMQLGIPKIAPTVGLVDETLLEGINSSFFYTKGVVPLSRDDERGVLTVLMDDPLDFGIITDLEKIYKTKIEPAVSTTGETTRLLDCLYDPETRHGLEASLTLPSKEETVIGVSALKLAGGEADPSLPKLRRQTRETRQKPPETDAPGPLPSGKVRLTGGMGRRFAPPEETNSPATDDEPALPPPRLRLPEPPDVQLPTARGEAGDRAVSDEPPKQPIDKRYGD